MRGHHANEVSEQPMRGREESGYGSDSVHTTDRSLVTNRARIITGEVNHRRIVVCLTCMKDVPEERLHLHTCDVHTIEARGQTGPDQPDWGWGWTGQGGGDTGDEQTTPCNEARGNAWDETVCQGCSLPLHTPGVQWRLCRCYLPYCITCASGPCTSCCVLEVWNEGTEAEEQTADTTTDSDAQRRETETRQPERHGEVDPPRGPAEIHADRCRQIDEARAEMRQKRQENRELRKAQIRAGTRPRREQERGDGRVTFITTNATCHNSLKRELEHGETFRQGDYILLQEHGLSGDPRTQGEAWAIKQGYDAIIDNAYFKEAKNGGGTGILANTSRGVRRSIYPEGELEGRLSIGIGQMDGEFVAGSWYGISGEQLQDSYACSS